MSPNLLVPSNYWWKSLNCCNNNLYKTGTMNKMQIKTLEEYHEKYAQSVSNPEAFWEEIANEFQWMQKWDKVLEWNFKEPIKFSGD